MDSSRGYTFSELLKQFRVRERMSQQELSEQLGVHRNTIGAWERGDGLPKTRSVVLELTTALRLNTEDKDTLLQASLWEYSVKRQEETGHQVETTNVSDHRVLFWNIPYRRNPFFTGREAVLNALHDMLASEKAAELTQTRAIVGLGGIGKTQTAVEYAYRHRDDYQAILWARADSRDVLISDFISIAELLKLPEKDEQDQSRAVQALKRWLQDFSDWLLVFDNADDLVIIGDLLPATGRGHILLTSREQATGTLAQQVEIDKMLPEEGALFLLRRTKIIAPNALHDNASYADWITAKTISQAMDGLPLALDQAGAYIEATACGLAGYLKRYQTQRAKLLSLRGTAPYDHPEPVATTWSLSFEKVQAANPAAAELLRFCAFLHPDAIPEEIITEGAPELFPILQPVAADLIELDTAIQELRRFSLLRRDSENQILNVHRLVQTVLRDGMDEYTQRQWAERTVRAINRTFPDVEFTNWNRCQRCLPHVLVCVEFIERWNITFPEAARLLHQAGSYLGERAQYAQAELLLQRALAILEQTLGPDHPDLAQSLNRLVEFYFYQGKYTQAEPFCQRALTIREQTVGPMHSDVAESLNNLAMLYQEQSKYEQAEPLLQRALVVYEKTLGSEHPDVNSCLSNLGLLYYAQGKYAQAEPICLRAVTTSEQTLGPEHPLVAFKLDNLAAIYHTQGKYEQAEPLLQRALAVREKALGAETPYVANSLNTLGRLYYTQGKYEQAEPLYQRALAIYEKYLGSEHPDVATSLNNLAQLYYSQGRYVQAESCFQRGLGIRERALGPDHPDVAQSLNDLGKLYEAQGKYKQAEPLLQRALAIRQQALEPEHPDLASSLESYTDLLRKTKREIEVARQAEQNI